MATDSTGDRTVQNTKFNQKARGPQLADHGCRSVHIKPYTLSVQCQNLYGNSYTKC